MICATCATIAPDPTAILPPPLARAVNSALGSGTDTCPHISAESSLGSFRAKRTSGWGSKASEAELKGVEGGVSGLKASEGLAERHAGKSP